MWPHSDEILLLMRQRLSQAGHELKPLTADLQRRLDLEAEGFSPEDAEILSR